MPMSPNAPAALPAGTDALLSQARRALHAGAWAEGLLPPALAHVSRSWQRSLAAGLSAFGRRPPAPKLTHLEVARASERQHELLAHARPVMEYLMRQTREHAGMVILADADGLLLHALGDVHFLRRAERVALSPGACWHEAQRGTNAIGTALAEAAPVMVHGAEHFLECNGFLTCAAAPVTAPDGRVVGVLDFSGERQRHHPQLLHMVQAASQMIENRLFATRHGQDLQLHFHPLPEGIGTLAEGVLAVSAEGRITGANPAALNLLGLRPQQLGRVALQKVLDTSLEQLLRHAHGSSATLCVSARTAATSLPLHVRVLPPVSVSPSTQARTSGPTPVQAPSTMPAPLRALDTGDATWRAVLHKAHRVLDQPIALLLHGESGTGKEVLARAIHHSSARSAQPFVAVNCAALPEHLIEAELFGYSPGAFTGARREGARGFIRQAEGGTLFLDEIGDMPLAMQTRLLRVLQDRHVTPLGGGAPVPVDFALICATHRDLRAEVAAGRFRDDLYWRLNGLTLRLPPLRQRSDWDALAALMLAHHAPGRTVVVQAPVAQALRAYAWPGNLRQLDSSLRTAVALLDAEGSIGWQHLPDDLAQELRASPAVPPAPAPALSQLARLTEQAMRQALAQAGGNISQAARALGIGRSTLYRRLGASARADSRPSLQSKS